MSELPPTWVKASLRELAVEAQAGFASGQHNAEARGVAHLRPMNIDRLGRIDLSVVKHVETETGHRLAAGDVLFNNTNSPELVGKTAFVGWPADYAFSNHMTRLRPPAGIDPKLLALQLHRLWNLGVLRALCRNHVNQASISTGRLLDEVSVVVPPENEQRRIVAAIEEQFSRLDAADESIRLAELRAEQLGSSIVALLTRGPWPSVRLADVTRSQAYGTSAKADADPAGVPVLRMGNIQAGEITMDSLKYLPIGHPDASKLVLEKGDLLFNRTNSPELVGKSAVFQGAAGPTTFASYLIRVRLTDECLPEWASLVINGPIGRRYVAAVRTQQVGQANVNGTKLAALPLPLPPVSEQRHIVAEVEKNLSLGKGMREATNRAHRRSANLRCSILERAFRGDLVPQDPSDEPASVLLERIRAERSLQPLRGRRRAGVLPTS